jgi:hypothetical protein
MQWSTRDLLRQKSKNAKLIRKADGDDVLGYAWNLTDSIHEKRLYIQEKAIRK